METYIYFFEIDPVEVGKVYKPFPLHCTLMGLFSSDADVSILENIARTACSKQKSFQLVSAEPALFGPNEDIPVFTLVPHATFKALHLELLEALEQIGAKQGQPSYAGPNYRMHVTNKGGRSFPTGNTKTADRVLLARVINDEAPKTYRILAAFPLG